jgi:hypothetical protein
LHNKVSSFVAAPSRADPLRAGSIAAVDHRTCPA